VSFPLPQPEVQSLLQGLSERVGELYRLETQAAAALDQAARRAFSPPPRRDQARTKVL